MTKKLILSVGIAKENTMSYTVYDKKFKTKQEIVDYCREIIVTNTITQYQKEFLLALLKTDIDRYNNKRGDEVIDIFVGKAMYNTKCFYLKRNDNTNEDFSYRQVIGKLKRNKQ